MATGFHNFTSIHVKSVSDLMLMLLYAAEMSSRLGKQTRLFCGHCNEYLSRAAFWKHRRAYYNVQKEHWMTEDGAEDLEHEAKKPKYHPDHEPCKHMWSSDSSGDEDLEAAMPNHGM